MFNASYTDRVALVTGGNKGIGLETVHQLAETGMIVLMGVRSLDAGQDAAGKLRAMGLDVRPMVIDVTREETIAAAVLYVSENFGRLDILVNNAGILDENDNSPVHVALSSVRRTFDTNFFGPLAVTQAFLHLLKQSKFGRIVNVSSSLGSITLNADPDWTFAPVKPMGYNGSKAALNMLTVQLAYELRDTPIKVNAADPGYTPTDLNEHLGDLSCFGPAQTVQNGARAQVKLALLPDDGPTGGFFDARSALPW